MPGTRSGVRLAALTLTIALGSGCVGNQWGTQGVPFFAVGDDARQSLEQLKQLETFLVSKIGHWDLSQAEEYVRQSSSRVREADKYPEPLPERLASVNGTQAVITRVWRFTTSGRKSMNLPLYGRHRGQRVGYVLQVDERDGKLARVQTSFTYLTDQEQDLSTKPLIAGALAVAGALILLSAP